MIFISGEREKDNSPEFLRMWGREVGGGGGGGEGRGRGMGEGRGRGGEEKRAGLECSRSALRSTRINF